MVQRRTFTPSIQTQGWENPLFVENQPTLPASAQASFLTYIWLSPARRKLERAANFPPQRIQDGPVWKDADQPVLHGDVMQEGLFGVDDERVGDPEQLHQPPVQAQALVPLKDETLVGPALAEEYGGGVVLQQGEDDEQESFWSGGLTATTALSKIHRIDLKFHFLSSVICPGGSCLSGCCVTFTYVIKRTKLGIRSVARSPPNQLLHNLNGKSLFLGCGHKRSQRHN